MNRILLAACVLIATLSAAIARAAAPADPYLWLEDVTGTRALDWAKEQNQRTDSALAASKDFAYLKAKLLDMERYTKLSAGQSWVAEYGDPAVPADLPGLRAISPYRNVKAGVVYPPVLFTSSTRDDRVNPAHARKMVAKMEAQGHDVFYFENIEGGHAGASVNDGRAYLYALTYGFLWDRLMRGRGAPPPAGASPTP